MSGSRDQRRTIKDKFLDEIRSTFALVKKDFRQFPVDFAIESDLTVYSTSFHCESHALEFQSPALKTSQGLQAIQASETPSHACALIEKATVAADKQIDADWEPSVRQVPVYDHPEFFLHQISFDNLELKEGKALELKAIETSTEEMLMEAIPKTRSREIPLSKMKTQKKAHHFAKIKSKARPFEHAMYGLPFLRKAIPAHRFSAETRKYFRNELAKKAETEPANVLINRIYDRVNATQFQSISQDEQGLLVCIPKTEFVGSRRKALTDETSFLVMGQKLKNKENISALIPQKELDKILEMNTKPPSSPNKTGSKRGKRS